MEEKLKGKKKREIVLRSLNVDIDRIFWYIPREPDRAGEKMEYILTTLPKPFTRTARPGVYRREGVISILNIPDEIRLKFTAVTPADKPDEIHTRVDLKGSIPKVFLYYLIAVLIPAFIGLLFALARSPWVAVSCMVLMVLPFFAFSIEAQCQKTRIMLDYERISDQLKTLFGET